jgi:archaellum component FlaC
MEPSRYLEQYLAPLAGARHPLAQPAAIPELDLHHFYPEPAHQVEAQDLTLAQLYAAGVECGHIEARTELKRRVAVVAGQIERRVAAVTGALQSRIGELEQYRVLREQAMADRDRLAAELRHAQDLHLAARVRVGETQGEVGRMQGEITEILLEVGRMQGSFGRIDNEASGIESSIERLGNEVEWMQIRVGQMQADATQMQADATRMQEHAARIQGQLAEMQRVSEQMQVHTRHLEAAVAAARARIAELESSTTWKLTAPLRRIGHRLKILLARWRAMAIGARRVPRQAGMAMSILRNEGAGALARRVHAKLMPTRQF